MTTTIAQSWTCIAHEHLAHCDAAGTGPRSDRDAEKHTRTTGHSTASIAEPEETAA